MNSVFTITGLPGSGTTTIAKMLCKRLDLEYFSPGQYFRKLAEARGSGIERFWSQTTDRENIVVDKEQITKARKGRVVLDGRYSAILCYVNDVKALKIYLDASPEVRAERVKKREPEKSLDEIMETLKKREENEIKRGKNLYNSDFTNPLFYDMYINTDKMTPEQIFKLIMRKNNIFSGVKQLPAELLSF